MMRNGADHLHRLLACVLTVMLLMTTCLPPAFAAGIQDQLMLNIHWTDDSGTPQMAAASAVSEGDEPAYWVNLDAAAMNRTLTVEALHADPAYSFYLLDEWGNPTKEFVWLPEMDAMYAGYEYAYQLFYDVNGERADMPVLLYVSSIQMPGGDVFQSYPVQVPVFYLTEDGVMLDSQYVECWAGETTPVWASSRNTADYALMGADRVDVHVDESGAATPSEVTFVYRQLATEVPTEAPTPTPVAQVAVPVVYYHENGTQLDFQEIFLTPGIHVVHADSRKTDGYLLIGEASVQLTVFEDGTTDQGSVVFMYTDAAPTEAVIPVYYYHADGTLLDMKEVRLAEGTHTIQPDSAAVAGLELEGASAAEVTVFADGSASVAYVVFTYHAKTVAPVEAKVNIHYYHIDLGLLDSQTILLTEGVHKITASSSKVEGYIPVGSTEVEVTVFQDGSTEPGSVDFYYEDAQAAAVNAELSILYLMDDQTIYASETRLLTPGSHTISPKAEMIKGMMLVGDGSYVVNVDGNGTITPNMVTFVLRQAAATITVHYQDDRGRDVAPAQSYTYQDGSYVITATPENLPAEYELAPGLHTQVTVTIQNGVASQSDVFFYYQQRQPVLTKASVTVHYYDTEGQVIASAQTVSLEPGMHQLRAEPVDLPQGYELISEPSVNVEVYENGSFYPQEIAFYYRKAQAAGKTAPVIIYFCDDRRNEVATAQTIHLPEGQHTIKAEPQDLKEGYVIFAGTDDTAKVNVRNGVAYPAQVVFYYQKAQNQPTVYDLPVMYYDTEGKQIAKTQYVQVAPGTYAIIANPEGLPEGYELMMEDVMTVIVNQDGSTNPEEIAFYYRPPQKKASVPVIYLDEAGQQIAESFTMALGPGYHTIQADIARVPGGYDPASAQSVQVYVSREGEANPAQVKLFFKRQIIETPIPVGAFVYRYAAVNGSKVAFRSEPSTSGGEKTAMARLSKNDIVYVMQESYNSRNERWAMVVINGRTGYMMSKYLDIMTQQESDAYAAGATPAPTFTPAPTNTAVPTEIPTMVPTEAPTATPTLPPVELITPPAETPTLEPLPSDSTEAPTATPKPTAYVGYALTTRATALRTGVSASDMSVIQTLEANELVNVIDQMNDPVTGESWSIIMTLAQQPGYVQSASLRYITEREAQPYLLLWTERNKTPEPTQLTTATPEPMQLQGYGVVLGDGVPFRQMESEFSRIIENLDEGTIVYITGQTPGNGQYWHSVNYNNRWGYIRADLVRMMTIAEEEAYLESQKATPTPATSNIPFDVNGLSSYGYVEGSSVNWRENPSTNAKIMGELKRYALCLVLSTRYINGTTWYEVKYDGKTGYLHGDYFRQMTMTELDEFLGSDEYLQGRQNNAVSGDSAMDQVGVTGTGGIVSAEDQWVNKNPDVYASFEPFNPIATVAPITSSPTLEPLPYQTAAPTAMPSPTPIFNPMPDVTYPTTEENGDGSLVAWIVVVVLLLLAGGGIFVMVRHQQNKRRMAMRAAQRRAQAARAQQQRPYARTAVPNQTRTGMYPNQQTSVRRPVATQPGNDTNTVSGDTSAQNRYSSYSGGTAYSAGNAYRPTEWQQTTGETPQMDAPMQQTPRVGRRTAYRQAHEDENQSDSTLDL